MADLPEMPALPEHPSGCYWTSLETRLLQEYAQAYAAAAVAVEREAIIALLPGGDHVDPQWVADAIRERGA